MTKLKRRPKAVLFDMDGVIVDSMPYHFLAWHESLRPFGIRVSCFDVYSKEGERWDKSLKEFLSRAGIKPTSAIVTKIFRLRQNIFRKYFKRLIFQGVEEFLSCLKQKGYLLGLVTGTPMPELKKILPRRIEQFFDAIVTGDRVRHGKPHPESYRRAAKLLNLEPGECLVVENAPLGIQSAKAAGMFCAAITTSLPCDYLKKADVVVDRLEEVINIIEKTCKLVEYGT